MKPADFPDFFSRAAPAGTSRESQIRLDASGNFWVGAERIEHAALSAALHGWIARHPDDGRYILSNGHDWTYFHVDDAPYTVRSIRVEPTAILMLLSDGSEEWLVPETLWVGSDGAVYVPVKGSSFSAKFSRHAQTQLAPLLHEADDGGIELAVGPHRFRMPDPSSAPA